MNRTDRPRTGRGEPMSVIAVPDNRETIARRYRAVGHRPNRPRTSPCGTAAITTARGHPRDRPPPSTVPTRPGPDGPTGADHKTGPPPAARHIRPAHPPPIPRPGMERPDTMGSQRPRPRAVRAIGAGPAERVGGPAGRTVRRAPVPRPAERSGPPPRTGRTPSPCGWPTPP